MQKHRSSPVGWPTAQPSYDGSPVGWPRIGDRRENDQRETVTGEQDSRAADVPEDAGAQGDLGAVAGDASARDVSRETFDGTSAAATSAEQSAQGDLPGREPARHAPTDSRGETLDDDSPQAVQGGGEPGAGHPVQPTVGPSRAPRRLPDMPRPPATRVLTIANQKGGVGKTTTTVNMAAALAQGGLRVLVIDTDPQGNASTALGIDHHSEVPSVYDVLVDSTPLGDVVQECPDVPGLFCVPATIDLAGAEIELVSLVAREQRLWRALTRHLADLGPQAYDYVLVDCPPSLGLLTVNAFVAGQEVLIPIQCEYYALEGLSQLLKNVEMIRQHLNPELHVSSILMTMYDGRTRLSAQVAEEVRHHFPDQVLRATVPRSVRISEAPSHGLTVMTYDPSSSGALSYADAARELADRGAAR